MPFAYDVYTGADAKVRNHISGINFFCDGPVWVQYGDGTAVANSTTQTSVVTNSTSATANFLAQIPTAISSTTIPGNGMAPASLWQSRLFGQYSTTSTPTLTVAVGFVNAAGTFTAVASTAAITMPSSVTSMDWELETYTAIRAVASGSTNNTVTKVAFRYRSAAATELSYVVVPTLATVDFTQNQTFDVRVTWGTASASNTIIANMGVFKVVG